MPLRIARVAADRDVEDIYADFCAAVDAGFGGIA